MSTYVQSAKSTRKRTPVNRPSPSIKQLSLKKKSKISKIKRKLRKILGLKSQKNMRANISMLDKKNNKPSPNGSRKNKLQ